MSRGRSRGHRDDITNDEAELEASQNLLSRLTKQYRMMERNRKQYYDETVVLLKKQRKMLQDLEKEKLKLEDELQLCASPKNKFRDNSAKNAMSAILERQRHYEDQIEEEKEKIKELDLKICGFEKEIRAIRRKLPSAKHLEVEKQKAKSANTILENRIQQTTVRLNSILADNSVLRNEIENLLKERDKFLLQASRLEKQLIQTTRRKSDLMDQVTKAYTEREEAQSKMRSMKDRIDRDTIKFTNEMKKIQRAIDYQTNLHSFVTTIAIGDDDEFAAKKHEGEGVKEASIETTLENYRASISHLQEASQEMSIDNLVSNYLQADNDNYTLFSYISDLNNEVTALSGDIVNLREEIENIVGKGDSPRKEDNNALGHYKEEITKLTKEVVSLEEEERKARHTLFDINEGASKLFYLLECDLKPVHGLVGESEVTSSSLPTFLSVIEQKVEEICKLKEKLEIKSKDVTPRQDQNQNETGIDAQTDTTPSSITKTKPVIPHIVHPVDDDGNEPTTHGDLLSSLRARRSDSFDS